MKRQKDAVKAPGRLTMVASRVRRYPSWWMNQYKRGRDEGRERAGRARTEYRERQAAGLAQDRADREEADAGRVHLESPDRDVPARIPEGYTREQRHALVSDLLSSRARTRSEMAAIRAIQLGRNPR